MNASAASEAKLIVPGLRGFYATFAEVAYTLMRIVIGYILFRHGLVKFQSGAGAIAGYMGKQGLEPGVFFAYAAIFLETVGAACIVLGLFTRFFAAALAIEMAIALLFVHLTKGFSAGQGGYEYVLLLGIVMFFIAIRGGGRYSVDCLIGKEL